MDDRPDNNMGSTFDNDMAGTGPPAQVYPSKAKTVVIMFSLYISIFLVALDRTIIGPAIPAITNDFNSIDDIGWYGSSYMLTAAGFILLYGRVYTFFSTKIVFLSGIFLFEIGSVVCGAAVSSTMLIVGRAIAGLGSSGIFTGAILIMLNTVPLEKRPMLQGLFGACFGVASVAGPLLGGAFTQSSATWRWCFWINLPLGGVTILAVFFLLKLDEQKPKLKNWGETVRQLDPLGTLLFLPAITCLLLALEWGAAEYSWSSPRIIALLVVFAVLLVAFIAWQYVTRHTTATIPAHIILQRSVACGGASQFCVGATMLTVSIYIPLWFQAIKGVSAMQSGINTIPLVLSVVVGSILSGGLVQRFGYYTPFMIVGSALMALGVGLITTWDINTTSGMWIGYQILVGFGVGSTMQHPNIAVQTVLRKQDVPIGTAILSLCQTLGGAVFTAVGQNLYISKFTDGLREIGGIEPHRILGAGATDMTRNIPDDIKVKVLQAYNVSLTKGTFFAALIIACFALPAALGMEWRSVKDKQEPPSNPGPKGDVEKQDSQPQPPRGILKTPAGAQALQEAADAPLEPPKPSWRKTFRASGHFSSYLTAKVNPDLRGELGAPK
jgi:EmrB/QacA subfamily drug resistance transporter